MSVNLRITDDKGWDHFVFPKKSITEDRICQLLVFFYGKSWGLHYRWPTPSEIHICYWEKLASNLTDGFKPLILSRTNPIWNCPFFDGKCRQKICQQLDYWLRSNYWQLLLWNTYRLPANLLKKNLSITYNYHLNISITTPLLLSISFLLLCSFITTPIIII